MNDSQFVVGVTKAIQKLFHSLEFEIPISVRHRSIALVVDSSVQKAQRVIVIATVRIDVGWARAHKTKTSSRPAPKRFAGLTQFYSGAVWTDQR
jgi:hypothetical protein